MGTYPYGMTRGQVDTLRRLAHQYMEICALPVQGERRELWRRHNHLEKTRIPVLCSWLWSSNTEWNLLKDECVCQEGLPLFVERWLRNRIFHHTLGDDMVMEPWIPVRAVLRGPNDAVWGDYTDDGQPPISNIWGECQDFIREGNGWKAIPFITGMDDIYKRVIPAHHKVDETKTAARKAALDEIFDGILPVSIDRRSLYISTYGGCDLSEAMGKFIGIGELWSTGGLGPITPQQAEMAEDLKEGL